MGEVGGLRSNQQNYQQCFIGHSQGASWRETFEQVCEEVLPNFDLKPWYADKHYQGSVPLRQKVVNMIATTRYGIYDLSYWRENDQSAWIMPRNVLIELGMAIALNRPMLLLRHGKNRECGLTLPACLEGVDIGDFGDGKKLLKETLNARLPSLTQHTPKQDWLNRYCHFGGLECSYREAHPQAQQWGRQKIHIHVSDGANAAHVDCSDFHDMIEEDVIYRFNDLEFTYLDNLNCPRGCKFLLCSRCQEVRSSPFAIYRITPHTSADTFIAIGMSIALEKQFSYPITKIIITNDDNNIPSLLKGYEIIVERNYARIKDRLNLILPEMIEKTRQTTWKPQPLPFEVFLSQKETVTAEAIVKQEAETVTAKVNPLDDAPSVSQGSATVPATNERGVGPTRFILRTKSGEILQEYPLTKAETVIGRAPTADILLTKDKLTSRRHATVHYENGQYILHDDHSANGTFVNREEIGDGGTRVLQDGDLVEIGKHELIFRSFDSVSVNIDKEAARNKPMSGVGPARFILRTKSGEILQEYPLTKAETVIGRAPTADILLTKDKLTSRRHAIVHYENGQYTLQDEYSAVGTSVNGQEIKEMVPRILQDGDHVLIGEHELIFRSFDSVLVNIDKEAARNKPVSIFVSYAHRDEVLLNELRKHLRQLEREGLIDVWKDCDITPGMEWARSIDRQLNIADFILLLVSADFVVSEYCYSIEMKRAMERHERGEARVVPIILRPVDWQKTPFGKLQALPIDAKPIVSWSNRDAAFFDVVQGIRRAIEEWQERR